MRVRFKDMVVGQRFFAWGDEFFYDYPKACIFEKESDDVAVEIENEEKRCRVAIDPNDVYGTDVLLAPKWLKERMETLKKLPFPTEEQVRQQFEASANYREPTLKEFLEQYGVQDEKGRVVVR